MIPSSRLAGPMAWMYHHSNTIPKEEYVSNEKEQRMKSVTLLLDKSLSETKNHNTYKPMLLEKEKRIAKATL